MITRASLIYYGRWHFSRDYLHIIPYYLPYFTNLWHTLVSPMIAIKPPLTRRILLRIHCVRPRRGFLLPDAYSYILPPDCIDEHYITPRYAKVLAQHTVMSRWFHITLDARAILHSVCSSMSFRDGMSPYWSRMRYRHSWGMPIGAHITGRRHEFGYVFPYRTIERGWRAGPTFVAVQIWVATMIILMQNVAGQSILMMLLCSSRHTTWHAFGGHLSTQPHRAMPFYCANASWVEHWALHHRAGISVAFGRGRWLRGPCRTRASTSPILYLSRPFIAYWWWNTPIDFWYLWWAATIFLLSWESYLHIKITQPQQHSI